MSDMSLAPPSSEPFSAGRFVRGIARVLLATYFLASATAMLFEPVQPNLFDQIMAQDAGYALSMFILFTSALAIILGVCLRPAAFVLGLFLLASSVADPAGSNTQVWHDLALMGALLMLAVSDTSGPARLDPSRPARPDRIVRKEPRLDMPGAGDQDENLFADLWDTERRRDPAA